MGARSPFGVGLLLLGAASTVAWGLGSRRTFTPKRPTVAAQGSCGNFAHELWLFPARGPFAEVSRTSTEVTGLVVTSHGRTLPNVEVVATTRVPLVLEDLASIERFEAGAAAHDLDEPVVVARCVTDVGGAFRLSLPTDQVFELTALAPGYASAVRKVAGTNTTEGTVDVRVIVVPSSSVRVRLIGTGDATFPRLRARLFHEGGSSGAPHVEANGEIVFPDVPPGAVVALVKAKGFRAAFAQGAAAAETPLVLSVPLVPIGTIAGVVVDPDGSPMPGARVDVVTRRGDHHLVSDPEGRFEVADPFDAAGELTAAWPAQTRRSWRVFRTPEPMAVRAPATGLRVVVVPVGGVRLRLVDADGAPILSHANVSIDGAGAPGAGNRYGSTMKEGVFALGDLLDGTYSVNTFVGSWPRHSRDVTIVNGRPVDLGDLVVDPGGPLEGRVVDSAGRPIANAWVGAASDEVGGTSGSKTDADGAFRIEGVPRDLTVQLRAQCKGYLQHVAPAVAGERAELRLLRPGKIRGRVECRESGAQRPAWKSDFEGLIELRRSGRSGELRERMTPDIDPHGGFEQELAPGVWAAFLCDGSDAPLVAGTWTLGEDAVVDAVVRVPCR
jgi:hypothetical protein